MQTHTLKTVNPWFSLVWNGEKQFEIRRNDRNFKKGDWLILEEFELPDHYSGRRVGAIVKEVFDDFPGLQDGFVLLLLHPKMLTNG